ncbi:MAG: hypothetical protein FH749_15210 [Firmicutes bacterium]|nr:hypothetical protein [Bacillota bacterium]
MAKEIVTLFWQLISKGEFEQAGQLMHEAATVWLPNTREVFRGRDKYVDFNKKYPGRWLITIEQLLPTEKIVVSAVKVEEQGGSTSFYATSFFTIQNNLITEIIEYWGDNSEPPQWRLSKSLSERY